MNKDFTAAYLQGLAHLINRFPAKPAEFAAQSAIRMLAAHAVTVPDYSVDLSALKAGLANTIDVLKKFETNLVECVKTGAKGDSAATADKLLNILAESLGLAPAPGTKDAAGEGAAIERGFYRTPEGRIAEVFENQCPNILLYSYDDDLGPHMITDDELAKWTHLPDLKDFPGARDPKLPSEFVLQWSIRRHSEIAPYLRDCPPESVMEFRTALLKHGIPDPTQPPAPAKRRYIVMKKGRND